MYLKFNVKLILHFSFDCCYEKIQNDTKSHLTFDKIIHLFKIKKRGENYWFY